jgi:hypothetical protein
MCVKRQEAKGGRGRQKKRVELTVVVCCGVCDLSSSVVRV